MGKKIQGNLPVVQESAMLALYTATLFIQVTEKTDTLPLVRGRGVSMHMGGKWTNYRHKAMLKLQEQGLVTCHLGYERGSSKKIVWRYGLTQHAYNIMTARSEAAKNGWWFATEPMPKNVWHEPQEPVAEWPNPDEWQDDYEAYYHSKPSMDRPTSSAELFFMGGE